MRLSLLSIPLLLAGVLPAAPQPSAGMPFITSVEPASGKADDVITVQGVNLNQNSLAALYLTDGALDVKVVILDQGDTAIRFKIPHDVKPGRYALMILTKATPTTPAKLIEEPVKMTVEPDTGPSVDLRVGAKTR